MPTSTITEDYAASLADLTFNSRPIIDNLTIIAKENTDNARDILAAITGRIYKCIPEQKLFALYLLDSIVKTVGPPYNVIAGESIFKIFSHVYLLVGEATRTKLVRIYELWRVTKTKGSSQPLFPPDQLAKIGDFLRSAGYRKGDAAPTIIAPSAASLVSDIDAILPVLQQKIAANPSDAALIGKQSALAELRILLLSSKLQPNELLGISEKLAPMKRQELVQAPVVIPTTPLAPEVTPVPPQPSRAEAIFSALIASGLVTVDQSLKPGSKPEYGLVLPKHKYMPGMNGAPSANALEQLLQDANIAGKSQYDQIKFKELVKISKKLTNDGTAVANLQKFVSRNELETATIQVLYETKASKCSQCGKRFTADDAGAARKRAHLDWHFRINQKQVNFKSNVQSRNWYLDDYEWVQFRDDDLLEYESAPKQAKVEVSAPLGNSPESYVVIPSNESNTSNQCTICREQIKPTYKDAIGEWVWDKCILVPVNQGRKKIVHVTCFEEASRKRGAEDEDRAVKKERIY